MSDATTPAAASPEAPAGTIPPPPPVPVATPPADAPPAPVTPLAAAVRLLRVALLAGVGISTQARALSQAGLDLLEALTRPRS